MRLPIYCMRDVKQGFNCGAITIEANESVAVRNFQFAVQADHNSMLSKYPEDFSLYQLGYIETDTGVIEPIDKICVCEATTVKE